MHLIQRSFIDNGKKVEHDASHSILKGLSHADSENEFSGASDNLISEWQVNQQSICYNLPGLALFISHGNFFEILFPHLQSLSGNQFINPRLSLVLPQTCLCIQSDPSRLKIMELICQIGHLALSDHDCNLMRNIMKDMPLLYKAYHPTPTVQHLLYNTDCSEHTVQHILSNTYCKRPIAQHALSNP